MATYDETARHACKLDGVGLVAWLDRFAAESMAADFSFDDTRRTAWPRPSGCPPERTDDVVCILRRKVGSKPAHLIMEAATEPQPDDLARLGVYELLLAVEVGGVQEDGPPVYGAILHLTGSRKGGPLMLTRSPRHPGVLVKPIEVWLADVSAEGALRRIHNKEWPEFVLSFLPLMRGGGKAKVVKRWKKAVEQVEDAEKQAAYRAFALVFAELIPEQVEWLRLLEGWLVRESQYLKTFEDRGEQRGELRARRADMIRVLQAHLKSAAPEAIRLAIEGTNDLGVLNRWFDAALKATSWADFQNQMKQP